MSTKQKYIPGQTVNNQDLIDRQMDIYRLFCTPSPTREMIEETFINNESSDLQDFIYSHLKPEFDYASGYQIICAAEDISQSQLVNGDEKLEADAIKITKH